MSEIITCPAPLDMLRTGSVCRITEDYDIWRAGQQVVFIRVCINEAIVAVLDEDDVYHLLVPFHLLEMDLTDATGRAHAAWWVRLVGANHASEGWRRPSPAAPTLSWRTPYRKRSDKWDYRSLYFMGCWGYADRALPRSEALGVGRVVPALADLDPTDDTRLPDGSRVVDALALKSVVEHLLTERDTP